MNLTTPIPFDALGTPPSASLARQLAADARDRCAKRGHLTVPDGNRCLDCGAVRPAGGTFVPALADDDGTK